jgi:maltokinase
MPDLHSLDWLPERRLHDWVIDQRWFASKSREVAHINVLEAVPLRSESPLLVLALMEAVFSAGTHETYQVPLGLRPEAEGWGDRVICTVDGWTVYDGLADPAFGRELLHRMRSDSEVTVDEGVLGFHWAPSASSSLGGTVDVRPVGVEQSNSSIVFSDSLILKAFRRVEPGENPELELLRFLSSRGFPNIAPLAGWYDFEGRLVDATLGILQEYLDGAHDGWELTLDELGRDPSGYLERVRALGEVTGELHTVLGSEASDPAFSPDEPSMESLSILTANVDEQIERVFIELPETEATEPILGRGQDVRERLQLLSHIGAGGKVIRTHGDYHLGQTMLTADRGWVVLDFEGEPARSLPERRLKRSPGRTAPGRSSSPVITTASTPRCCPPARRRRRSCSPSSSSRRRSTSCATSSTTGPTGWASPSPGSSACSTRISDGMV